MGVLSALAHRLFGDYSLYFVYRAPAPSDVHEADGVQLLRPAESDLTQCRSAVVAEQSWYLGAGCEAFALAVDDAIVAVCFYWYGERYKSRGFWPLREAEAKLVQIVVDPSARGRGLARALIESSARWMQRRGWMGLYARIWHSNRPSIRSFERAGWERIAFVAEVFPFGMKRKVRLEFPAGKLRFGVSLPVK